MQAQQLGQLGAQARAGHDGVDKPVLLQIFGPLKAGGQLFADRLADDARPGKTDQCAGLCQRDVAQRSKACRHAAGGGVGEADDVQPARLLKLLHGGGGFGHLHQRQNALLHAGAARRAKRDQRQLCLCGSFGGAGHFFAHGNAHAAH
ncbi:hypothetical protein SDC9_168457 [bioreactor metagenome]|uniref:Uncharacterized protein n=1 Tax=bioreactor metagenome TaxID=1076179 RepID=A0A645G2K9_9ZZZZ